MLSSIQERLERISYQMEQAKVRALIWTIEASMSNLEPTRGNCLQTAKSHVERIEELGEERIKLLKSTPACSKVV